jgi:hypothetical protein
MTFPTIPTAGNGRLVTGTQANETATRTFPAFSGLTHANGDLLIAVVVAYRATGASNATWSAWSSSFTEQLDVGTVNATDASATMSFGVATKITAGGEAGSLTVTQAATVDGDVGLFLMAITGWHGTTLPEYVSAFNSAAIADPAALAPSWGAADTLFIAVGGSGELTTTGSYTGMGAGTLTDYGDIVNLTATGDAQGKIDGAIGFRQNNTASEDVTTWATPDTSSARNCALVIAVRPATAATNADAGIADGTGDALQPLVLADFQHSRFGTHVRPSLAVNRSTVW